MSKPNASIVWPPIGTHNELALEGFAGNNWWKFETEMAKYGMVVIGGWMRRRQSTSSPWPLVGAASWLSPERRFPPSSASPP
jgi:hypothetical protein